MITYLITNDQLETLVAIAICRRHSFVLVGINYEQSDKIIISRESARISYYEI